MVNAPAVLSNDRAYRYLLNRRLSLEPGTCLFIMLNPSTADESQNDPTITRCMAFSRRWGYGTLTVVNLFAFRATDPKELIATRYPVGSENDFWIAEAAKKADKIICAWGAHGIAFGRGRTVSSALSFAGYELYCIPGPDDQPLLTAKHQPRHPLYLKADRIPGIFTPRLGGA